MRRFPPALLLSYSPVNGSSGAVCPPDVVAVHWTCDSEALTNTTFRPASGVTVPPELMYTPVGPVFIFVTRSVIIAANAMIAMTQPRPLEPERCMERVLHAASTLLCANFG